MTTLFLHRSRTSQYGRQIQVQNVPYDCTHSYGFKHMQNDLQGSKLCCISVQ
jgi:hypothetical protein